ncbi:hypothetical protein SAZ11_41230 [Streptomyces sp. FXJ1.4098]|nr:hypothetical protein [Streptomyces sp. FXJ1.4098]
MTTAAVPAVIMATTAETTLRNSSSRMRVISGITMISALTRPSSLRTLISPKNGAVPTMPTVRPRASYRLSNSRWMSGRIRRAVPSSTSRPNISIAVWPSRPTNAFLGAPWRVDHP